METPNLKPSVMAFFSLLFAISEEGSSSIFEGLHSLSILPFPKDISLSRILPSFVHSLLSTLPSKPSIRSQPQPPSPSPTASSSRQKYSPSLQTKLQSDEILQMIQFLHESAPLSVHFKSNEPIQIELQGDREVFQRVRAMQEKRRVLLEKRRQIELELSELEIELGEIAMEESKTTAKFEEQLRTTLNSMVAVLKKEQTTKRDASLLGVQSKILQQTHQFSLMTVKQIRHIRNEIDQIRRELEQIEKERTILHTLKLSRNLAEIEKAKKANEVLLQRWTHEEQDCVQKCSQIEREIAWVASHFNLYRPDQEHLAHIYSLFSLVGVSHTWRDFSSISHLVDSFREADRARTAEQVQPKKADQQGHQGQRSRKKDEKERGVNAGRKPKRRWNPIPQPPACSLDEIQKEELLKRQ